jgi:hypothetical protein
VGCNCAPRSECLQFQLSQSRSAPDPPGLLYLADAGLKSRFSEKLHFPDFTVEDTVQLMTQRLLKDYDLPLAPSAQAALPHLSAQVCVCFVGQAGRLDLMMEGCFRAGYV